MYNEQELELSVTLGTHSIYNEHELELIIITTQHWELIVLTMNKSWN
jgi:hypothetical protein